MRARGLLVAASILGACGTGAPPEVRAGGAIAAGASLVAGPAGPGDAIVATVEGRPVWASCVTAQAARGAGSRRPRVMDPSGPASGLERSPLDECIDFELLAQAAEARGLARDPEVGEARRRALVGRLVELGFEARYRAPADLRAAVDRATERYAGQLDQPELRASAFARVEVTAGAPPEADAAGHALADRIAGALAGETGLFPIHLREAADRIAAGSGQRVTHGDFRAAAREALVPPYAAALFSIPEVGRIAAPVRTAWGWDVILLTRLVEPAVHTRDEVAAKLFPDVRRQQFARWVDELASAAGIRVEIDPPRVARLLEGLAP